MEAMMISAEQGASAVFVRCCLNFKKVTAPLLQTERLLLLVSLFDFTAAVRRGGAYF